MVYNTECMHSKIKNMTNDKNKIQSSVNIIYFRDMYNNVSMKYISKNNDMYYFSMNNVS